MSTVDERASDATEAPTARRKRADAVRNSESVLEAAKAVFAESGVDAPMRDIAARAGVGVGTIYRSYPLRSDLIIAVFQREVDAVSDDTDRLAEDLPPAEALRAWAARYSRFVATKRGFAKALHSGDPAYLPLRDYFHGRMAPRLQSILDAGAREGVIRGDVTPDDLIHAISSLADGRPEGGGRSELLIGVLLDGVLTARV